MRKLSGRREPIWHRANLVRPGRPITAARGVMHQGDPTVVACVSGRPSDRSFLHPLRVCHRGSARGGARDFPEERSVLSRNSRSIDRPTSGGRTGSAHCLFEGRRHVASTLGQWHGSGAQGQGALRMRALREPFPSAASAPAALTQRALLALFLGRAFSVPALGLVSCFVVPFFARPLSALLLLPEFGVCCAVARHSCAERRRERQTIPSVSQASCGANEETGHNTIPPFTSLFTACGAHNGCGDRLSAARYLAGWSGMASAVVRGCFRAGPHRGPIFGRARPMALGPRRQQRVPGNARDLAPRRLFFARGLAGLPSSGAAGRPH